MSREPDWESLGSVNFLLHRRMAEHLNAALSAISLIGTEADENPAEFWQERAMNEVHQSLNLHNAWASLFRHKMGEHFLPQHMLQFRASEIVHWLAVELQLSHFDVLEDDVLLTGNRETLQEALLLLHSCANTLGPHVRLLVENAPDGMWFRIRHDVVKAAPPTLDKLITILDRLPNSWRAQNAVFELKRAHDFLSMNDCELHYSVGSGYCELAFFIVSTGKPQTGTLSAPQWAAPSQLLASDETLDTVIVRRPTTQDTTEAPPPAPDSDAWNTQDTYH